MLGKSVESNHKLGNYKLCRKTSKFDRVFLYSFTFTFLNYLGYILLPTFKFDPAFFLYTTHDSCLHLSFHILIYIKYFQTTFEVNSYNSCSRYISNITKIYYYFHSKFSYHYCQYPTFYQVPCYCLNV